MLYRISETTYKSLQEYYGLDLFGLKLTKVPIIQYGANIKTQYPYDENGKYIPFDWNEPSYIKALSKYDIVDVRITTRPGTPRIHGYKINAYLLKDGYLLNHFQFFEILEKCRCNWTIDTEGDVYYLEPVYLLNDTKFQKQILDENKKLHTE